MATFTLSNHGRRATSTLCRIKLVQRLTLLVGLLWLVVPPAWAQSVFINELTYDSQQLLSGRYQELVPNLIEIAGPVGTNVTSWSLVFYGSDVPKDKLATRRGRVYGSTPISGLIRNQQNGYGTLAYSLEPATLQTAPGSGIALVNAVGKVVQLVSYGGSMTAVNGPAAGMVAQVIPRVHSATNGIQSLQLQGRGSRYTDFTWSELSTYSPGRINSLLETNPQVFQAPTSVALSVSMPTVWEGSPDSLVVATVTTSAPVVGDQVVRLRVSGLGITADDYRLRDQIITILSGATSSSTVITIRNDAVVESTDSLRLTIDLLRSSLVVGADSTQTIAILDNDVPPGRFTLTEPLYNCATGVITFRTSGGDGTPITYAVPGVQRPLLSSNTGVLEDGLRADPKGLLITATQSGSTVSYSFDFAASCAENSLPTSATTANTGCGSPAGTLGQPFTLLPPSYDCETGVIRFNTSGGSGSPIMFSAPGITSPTTNCVETLDPGNTDTDTYTITATQDELTRTISWTRPCGSLRRAAPEQPRPALRVIVLGNPVSGDAIQIEVQGAEGAYLRTSLIDSQGRLVIEETREYPSTLERYVFPVRQLAGLFVVQVDTADRRVMVKVLKQ